MKQKEITEMIMAVAASPTTEEAQLRETFLQKKISRSTYDSKIKCHMNKSMHVELSFLGEILANEEKYPLQTPIAHLVEREADFHTFGDACLNAAGGYCDSPKFWWHLQLPDWIRARTMKHWKLMVKEKTTDKLISINILEFVVEIINYATLIEYIKLYPEILPHLYPVLKNWTDNMTTRSGVRKEANKSLISKALQRLLCSMMINNPLGLWSGFIPGSLNILADTLSRIYSESNTPPSEDLLLQKVPKLGSYMRFHPGPEFLSHLYMALSLGQKRGLPNLDNYEHFSPASPTL